MELKMNEYQLPEKISFNFEEIRAEVEAKSKEYAAVVYTEDQIKQAKTDRATLNKFVKAIDDKRKEVKSTYLKPYTEFETQCKEITGTINTAVKAIDDQVKGFEEKQKTEKLQEIKDMFWKTEFPSWVKLERIFNDKWLNKSVALSKVQEELETAKKDIEEAVEMLSNLPEFGFEAVEVYKSTLDVAKAVNEAQKIAEMQKIKKQKQEEQKKADESDNIPGQVTFNNPEEFDRIVEEAKAEPTPTKQWVAFQAYMSTDDALALKEFFNSRNIEFRKG